MSASSFNNSLLAHMVAILILPVNVLGTIPYLLISTYGISEEGLLGLHLGAWKWIGTLLFLLPGISLFISSLRMFYRKGKGTLAPWTPTKRLVTGGPYAHVRNPMIAGVVFVLLGEAFYFNSDHILIWALLFFLINHSYFVFAEEYILVKKFGESYLEYKKHVPRWIPRIKAWEEKKHES